MLLPIIAIVPVSVFNRACVCTWSSYQVSPKCMQMNAATALRLVVPANKSMLERVSISEAYSIYYNSRCILKKNAGAFFFQKTGDDGLEP